MDEKQEKRIVYQGGVTRRTSDFLCQDGELAECINITADGEELKVIPELETKMTGLNGTLVFVHKLQNGNKNYIYESSGQLYHNSTLLANSSHINALNGNLVKAIGKILIVALDGTLTYYIFKNGSYQYIGNNIPCPHMEFGMSGEPGSNVVVDNRTSYFKYIKADGYAEGVNSEGDITDKKLYDESVKGLYASVKKKAEQQKAFTLPFFIRYALKLYDGTYTHISNPIPLFPNSENTCFFNNNGFYLHAMFAVYKNYQVYDDWTDIVKNISIFISRGIEFYDLGLDATTNIRGDYYEYDITRFATTGASQEDISRLNGIYPFEYRSNTELENDLHSESLFYHLCDISAVSYHNTWQSLRDHFSHVTLENLTSQQSLPYDNFYSLAPLAASLLYDYNNRLNIAHVSRGFFDGFDSYSGLYQPGRLYDYDIYVRIISESGTRVVTHNIQNSDEAIGEYFFYPDPRANHVTIYQDHVCIVDADLIEHPGLNGAYYSRGWPDPSGYGGGSATATLGPNDVNTTPEDLFSYIITSEANNPFVFLAHGYNKVGSGNVLALSTQTQALSQGQFGQYPLLVFCDDGIWAMAVDATGLYQSIHPMSREVCINAGAIVQTDDAVLFVSKKGLMVINGREVTCVSTAMDGLPFNTQSDNVSCLNYENLDDQSQESAPWADIIDLAADATTFQTFLSSGVLHMAYDYIDARVMLFNSTYGYSWVWSMKDGGFTKQLLKKKILNVVNDYPDYLLQDGYGNLYTLYGKTREESVSTRRLGFLVTRPLKLSAPLTVSSVRELVNVGYWDNRDGYSVVRTLLIVSDNLLTWFPASSRFGAAAKYYRIALFVKMLPSERLSGTIIRLQDRRTNNLRK